MSISSEPRQRRHGRPPKVSTPASGDKQLDAAIEKYQRLYRAWSEASERAAALTRELERAEAKDDRAFAEAVRQGRAEPTDRKATRKTIDELAEAAHRREGYSLACATEYQRLTRTLSERAGAIGAQAREREREAAKTALAALEQVTPALEELHHWRVVGDWIDWLDTVAYESQFSPPPGAGGSVWTRQPAGSNGRVADTALVDALAGALAERTRERPDAGEEPAGGGAKLVTDPAGLRGLQRAG